MTINILSFIYSFFLIFGFSYQIKGNASLIFGGITNIIITIISFIILIYLFRKLLKFLYKLFDKYKSNNDKKSKSKFFYLFDKYPFLFSIIFIIICWLPYIISFYPGILSPDPSFQIKQFFGIPNKYHTYVNLIDKDVLITNHHPVMHTLLIGNCLKIGHNLGNDNFGLFIYSFIQILVLSSVLSYTIKYLKKINVNKKLRFIVLLIYSIVPVFPFYSMSLVKDVIFTSLLILYMIFIYNQVYFKKNINFKYGFLISILLILIILSRNNGFHVILLTFPLLFLLRKNIYKLIIIFIVFISFNYSYNNIILSGFGITNGSIREKLSIPFQQTARFVKYDYDKLSDNDIKVIDKVLDISDLGTRYKSRISDPVKNKFNKDTTSEELKSYFKVWFKCFFKDPVLYIDATISNTYGYFYPFATNWYFYYKYYNVIGEDGFNYHYNGLNHSRFILKSFGEIYPFIPILGLIVNISINVWMLFLLCGYLIDNKKKEGIIILSPALVSILICIASPVNTYFRYAMPFIFSMPLMVFMILNYVKE